MLSRETPRRGTGRRVAVGLFALLALILALAGPAEARKYSSATYSSPIALSADGKYVWSVNPGADNVMNAPTNPAGRL